MLANGRAKDFADEIEGPGRELGLAGARPPPQGGGILFATGQSAEKLSTFIPGRSAVVLYFYTFS